MTSLLPLLVQLRREQGRSGPGGMPHPEPRLALKFLPSGVHEESPCGACQSRGWKVFPRDAHTHCQSRVLGCILLSTSYDLEEATYSLCGGFHVMTCGVTVVTQS